MFLISNGCVVIQDNLGDTTIDQSLSSSFTLISMLETMYEGVPAAIYGRRAKQGARPNLELPLQPMSHKSSISREEGCQANENGSEEPELPALIRVIRFNAMPVLILQRFNAMKSRAF